MTIQVGNNPKAPMCAFGDDSQYKEILVYAFATFRRENLDRAIRRFNQVKKFHNIPEALQIHCRQLFSGKQREKIGIENLNIIDIKNYISRVIEKMNTVPCLVKYGYCKLDEHVTYEEMYPNDKEMFVHDDPKGILGLIANACFLPNQGLYAEDFEIFTSRDSTKIKYINTQRIQADKIRIGGKHYTRKDEESKLSPH